MGISRQAAITDAAIETLAREGSRGLTHRAVDRAAGLPEGSTSYYFRTRLALLQATVERLVELDETEIPSRRITDLDTFAEAAAHLLQHWTTVGRNRQLARYELTLEATRRPELRDALVHSGARLRTTVAELLRAVGVPAPERSARRLAAVLDGLLLDQITGAAERAWTTEELAKTIRALTIALAD